MQKIDYYEQQNKQLQEELKKQEPVDLDIVYLKGFEDGKQVNRDKLEKIKDYIKYDLESCSKQMTKYKETNRELYSNWEFSKFTGEEHLKEINKIIESESE